MKREFVINRHGKDYVLYAGLLDQAHQQGLSAVKTHLLQVPAPDNGQVAICLAEVTTEKGTFTGIGDADPTNVSRLMQSALIRMAETRAKARALRDAVNVGLVALEELAEGGADAPGEEGGPRRDDVPGGVPVGAPAGGAPRLSPLPSAAGPLGAPPAEILPFPGSGAAAAGSSAAGTGGGGVPAAPPAPRPLSPAARPAGSGGGGAAGPLPPTQTQLETIAKLARSTGRTVSTEGLTRAAASELITRLSEERYGARR